MDIIQGGNADIIITLPDSIGEENDVHAGLFTVYGDSIDHWHRDGITVDGADVYINLSQNKTINYPAGGAYLEVKWVDDNGIIHFGKRIDVNIIERFDKHIMEVM